MIDCAFVTIIAILGAITYTAGYLTGMKEAEKITKRMIEESEANHD